ncbi:S-adenosyl-L-methionine-dependent methyltransferase [Aspergillus japonicus CBS 114.51]|uniref:S-adenosyl-L-methionine-dependent methyltransferase n=1 Tax=Aspergillus japonicus CBS 114.51 TaxID=1448312 RepID=A0A8T8WJS4_ASPJA|nr:S-adenosyl-L-methionine-dependent methyltransferase [Aspergillus japonicus CBS 114.51]XP_025527042.1 S-adenosyl-L-methionine-dependent methyltransferase [Aspergillus japonicus CBS 114.51]RAH76075.1 S-adenosyl-L-methionine-dependent methyltransferase [Aspergillus japonicus CBS 114.51]RAH81148.1 S-adenosyl-L-methionine-dependent methyltransferase [Aspergillus japonicus CBS 114.51]
MTKVAIDLNLFEILVAKDQPMSLAELTQATGADPGLIARILRYLAAFHLLAETGVDRFQATAVTQALTVPGFAAGIKHHFEVQLPAWGALPAFLAATNYQNPCDRERTAFQQAHQTDQTVFAWFMGGSAPPRLFEDFSRWMSAQRVGQPIWLDVFPLERLLTSASSTTAPTTAAAAAPASPSPVPPLFVDVGGGVGHQCVELLQRLPQWHGRVVLEDLAPVVAQALPHAGFERRAHDFWTPQPVVGAGVYYLRNVLHDYPDEQCVRLLGLQRAAMGPGSLVLVDEIVCPARGAGPAVVDMDITLMACLAAQERTLAHWTRLFRAAGLALVEVVPYVTEGGHSVMVLERLVAGEGEGI